MITKKILRTEDDPTRRRGGASKDEQKAMNALVRPKSARGIIGPSRYPSKAYPNGNRRSVPARPAGVIPRSRAQHKSDFRTLGDYLLEGEKQKDGSREYPDGDNRVETAFSVNTGAANDYAELSPDQVREVTDWMGSTAALNTRIRKSATVHYVVSLPHEDVRKSSSEFWRTVAPRILETLDMTEHEALFVVHKDTENPHMHVMINRVHPQKETAVDPLRDLIALEALNRKLEKELNLKTEPGRHIDPETGKGYDWQAVKRGEIQVPKTRKRMTRVQVEKFVRQAKRDFVDKPFSNANSWTELENRLSEQGYTLRAEGRGMKLCKDGLEVKLTKVAGKGLGREKLEARFGSWIDYQGDKAEAQAEGVSVDLVSARRVKAVKAVVLAERNRLREWMEPMFTHGARVLETSEDTREPVPDYLGPTMDRDNLRKGLETLTPNELQRLHLATLAMRERVDQGQRTMAKEEGGRNRPAYFGAGNALINIDAALRMLETEAKVRQVNLQSPQKVKETQKGVEPRDSAKTSWKAVLVQNPDASIQEAISSFVQMSDEAVLGHLDATRKAVAEFEARKQRREYTPQMAKKNLCMGKAIKAMKAVLQQRGIAPPRNPFAQNKTNNKGIEM